MKSLNVTQPTRRRGAPTKPPEERKEPIGMRIRGDAVAKARAMGPDRLAELILAAE